MFAFLIAEGFIKTSNIKKYLIRLVLFALISQAPFYLSKALIGIETIGYNILFTLSLGLISLIFLEKIKSPFLSILAVSCLVFFAETFNFEYGAYGILLILSSYLFLLKKKVGSLVWGATNLIGLVSFFPISVIVFQIFSFGALPIMLLYNRRHGILISKWWFYWFYPTHLLILILIKLLFF